MMGEYHDENKMPSQFETSAIIVYSSNKTWTGVLTEPSPIPLATGKSKVLQVILRHNVPPEIA